MKTKERDFNNKTDLWIANSIFQTNIKVINKNGTVFKRLGYSSSFSIDEIYNEVKNKYPNKTFKIQTMILE